MSSGQLAAWRAAHVGFIFQLYNLLPVLTAFGTSSCRCCSPGSRARSGARSTSTTALARRRALGPRATTTRASSRAARSSASASPARSSPTRRCSSCDEPTGDLDRKAADEILDLLQALNRENGKTIVMVTHDPHAAARASRVLHLDKGVLVDGARPS